MLAIAHSAGCGQRANQPFQERFALVQRYLAETETVEIDQVEGEITRVDRIDVSAIDAQTGTGN